MSAKLLPIVLLPLAMGAAAAQAHAETRPAAEDAPPTHMGPPPQRGPISIEAVSKRVAERFASLDANHDNMLDPKEFESQQFGGRRPMRHMGPRADGGEISDELFKRLDADGNGELSKEELAEMEAVRRDMMKALVFERLDTNHDGYLTLDEFGPQLVRLKELDANGDGLVTDEERPHEGRRWRQPPSAGSEPGA